MDSYWDLEDNGGSSQVVQLGLWPGQLLGGLGQGNGGYDQGST